MPGASSLVKTITGGAAPDVRQSSGADHEPARAAVRHRCFPAKL